MKLKMDTYGQAYLGCSLYGKVAFLTLSCRIYVYGQQFKTDLLILYIDYR